MAKDINPQRLNFYLSFFKYDVTKDLAEKKNLKDLYEYKKKVLISNGFSHLVEYLQDFSPQFSHNQYDEAGLEVATDVDDVYPASLEEEKSEILQRALNLEYLAKTHKTLEYCRTRCKVTDQRLRNFISYPSENQMCVTDCMNIRTELFNKTKPGTEGKEKTFVWLA